MGGGLTHTGLVVVAVVLASTLAQAQQGTLTLACKGTTTIMGEEEPESIGVIVNFTARTVQGVANFPVKITNTSDVTVEFDGKEGGSSVHGYIDRVTGDMGVSHDVRDAETHRITIHWRDTLQCKAVQRMF